MCSEIIYKEELTPIEELSEINTVLRSLSSILSEPYHCDRELHECAYKLFLKRKEELEKILAETKDDT